MFLEECLINVLGLIIVVIMEGIRLFLIEV